MRLAYHWDVDLLDALLRYRARQILNYIGTTMATPTDIAKLVENMKRANSLIDRAAHDSEKNTAIMDRFEARLGLIGGHFSKIEEYEKQLAAMDSLGNGGPPLDETFRDCVVYTT